jgi:hypothetical protein
MNIDAYSFGRIVIDDVAYDDDVIILPTEVRKGWWRTEGHEVALFDIADVLDPLPRRLIIGTGAAGRCEVLPEVESYCRSQEIELLVLPTPEAVVEYNALEDEEKEKTIAALHVTC